MAYFSETFGIAPDIIDEYGAFDISLINDLPLFIDPFLIFGSNKNEFKILYNSILQYLSFLKMKSEQEGTLQRGQIQAWYEFPEVQQNWLGYSLVGNKGRGLGYKFGKSLSSVMPSIFNDIGNEKITESSHIEKACLFQTGVGRDNISDFTCNLIKAYLLEYTEKFAKKYLKKEQVKVVKASKVYFDYELEVWMPKEYLLPYLKNDYVLLTPKEILTKDDTWINSNDLHGKFSEICKGIPNEQLRTQITNYFLKKRPIKVGAKEPSKREKTQAIVDTINEYPVIANYYIKYKEVDKEGAFNASKEKVLETEGLYIKNVKELVNNLSANSNFFSISPESSYEESLKRVIYLKQVIENNNGYRFFYVKGAPIREIDIQLLFRLTWFATEFDVNTEVDNGRGAVDYKISKGASDKTLIEFKLASNSQLKRNLENQVKIYEAANNTKRSIKVILYFDKYELQEVNSILKELKLQDDKSIVMIDARNDNKPSASTAKKVLDTVN